MLTKYLTPIAPLILMSTSVVAEQCEFLSQLSPYQEKVAYKAYRAGEPYDLGLTAVAIAWKESKLGVYKTRFNRNNVKDISVGVMHTVVYWKTKSMTPFEAGMWVDKMQQSDDFSIQTGVSDLVYWQARAKGNWKRGVEMYNAGLGKNPVYVKSVVDTINKIKDCEF